MQAKDADVFLAGALLRLSQTRRAVDTHNQASRHLEIFLECDVNLGIQRSAVSGLLNAHDLLDPGDHLVT